MQKLFRIQVMVVLITIVTPTVCMKKDRLVRFAGDFNVISIKESHLQMMRAWDSHYKKYKDVADQGGILPGFPNVSEEELVLANNALTVGPYEFDKYYEKLSVKEQTSLQTISGQYRYDKNGKTLMLYSSELTKQLIDVCLPTDVRRHIKNYLDDEDDVRNYLREKLICNKRLLGSLMLKQPMLLGCNNDIISDDIYPSSLFLDGYHTNHCESPIPLAIAEKIHQTYATHFVTDTCEYRITDIKDNHGNLWVINHNAINNPNYTFSTAIEHAGNIKGCILSKTGTGVEYAVTYSDCDIVVSKITTQNDVSFVETTRSSQAAKNTIIVDICFNHTQDRLIIGKYVGMKSRVKAYTMDFKKFSSGSNMPFKEHGLLEKIFIGSDAQADYLWMLFGVAGRYEVLVYKRSDQGNYDFNSSTKLMTMYAYNCVPATSKLIKRGNSIFMYDHSYSPFKKIFEEEQEKSKENWFIQDLVNGSVERLDSECYRTYSPDGKFLLCNTLKKKSGTVYVETVLNDAVTHRPIVTIDTEYKDFLGVGFTHDGTELIFLNSSGLNYKVSLLNDDDKKMVQEMENIAFGSIGMTSLFARLCKECKEHGDVMLYEDDPARTMLREWSHKSPIMLKLLKQCLPFYTLKGKDKKGLSLL